MIYSLVEVIALPISRGFGPAVIVFSDGILKFDKWFGEPLTTLYCASFGLCLAQLTLHFAYRYIAICRNEKLYIFNGFKILLPMIPCVSVFVLWYLAVYITMHTTEEKQAYFKDHLLKNYNQDSFKVAFVAVIYKIRNSDGTWKWNLDQLFGVLICCVIMGSCFCTILFFACKTYMHMRISSRILSSRTKELNKQLFLTLGLQTLLPFFTMYMPVGLLIVLPIFEIDVGEIANQAVAYVALYTALDPLIAIFVIRRFRNAVLCREKKKLNTATSSGITNNKMQTKDADGTTIQKQ